MAESAQIVAYFESVASLSVVPSFPISGCGQLPLRGSAGGVFSAGPGLPAGAMSEDAPTAGDQYLCLSCACWWPARSVGSAPGPVRLAANPWHWATGPLGGGECPRGRQLAVTQGSAVLSQEAVNECLGNVRGSQYAPLPKKRRYRGLGGALGPSGPPGSWGVEDPGDVTSRSQF
jgi:hypothetical protein